MEKILVGDIVLSELWEESIAKVGKAGFESIALRLRDREHIERFYAEASSVRDTLSAYGLKLTCVSFYENPILNAGDRESWERLLDVAPALGCDMITGFTGAHTGRPMEESLEPFAAFFGPLAQKAADRGLTIGFENCAMGGTWRYAANNIAVNPDMWERMFNAVNAENLGLEWEPAHQIEQLIDPMPQLRKWVGKVVHVHGKDATVDTDVLKRHGIMGAEHFCAHRFPGYGETNWGSIFVILRRAGYQGAVDIEGWHDPIFKDELEFEGQLYALEYLKKCRDQDAATPEAR